MFISKNTLMVAGLSLMMLFYVKKYFLFFFGTHSAGHMRFMSTDLLFFLLFGGSLSLSARLRDARETLDTE